MADVNDLQNWAAGKAGEEQGEQHGDAGVRADIRDGADPFLIVVAAEAVVEG